jgi:hypothetical protein
MFPFKTAQPDSYPRKHDKNLYHYYNMDTSTGISIKSTIIWDEVPTMVEIAIFSISLMA